MDDYEAAVALWCRLYVETEEFDRTLPGRWSAIDTEAWNPVGRDAVRASADNRKATEMKINALRPEGISDNMWESARREARGYSLDLQRRVSQDAPPTPSEEE